MIASASTQSPETSSNAARPMPCQRLGSEMRREDVPRGRITSSPLLVRAITPSDVARLRAFHTRCSADTQYARFLGHKAHLSQKEAEYFCDVDMLRRGALVASSSDSPELIHGLGTWDAVTAKTAEIAFVVEDEVQGLGVGRHLLNAVLVRTRALGFRHLTGFMLVGNRPMRHLLQTSGYGLSVGEIDCGVQSFSLTPTVPARTEHRAPARWPPGRLSLGLPPRPAMKER